MGKNVYAKFSLGSAAGGCQDGSMCNPILGVVGNPNRTMHRAGFLKALTASSVCISANGITRVFMLLLKCNYIFRTLLLYLVVRNIPAKEHPNWALNCSQHKDLVKEYKNVGLVIFWIIWVRLHDRHSLHNTELLQKLAHRDVN